MPVASNGAGRTANSCCARSRKFKRRLSAQTFETAKAVTSRSDSTSFPRRGSSGGSLRATPSRPARSRSPNQSCVHFKTNTSPVSIMRSCNSWAPLGRRFTSDCSSISPIVSTGAPTGLNSPNGTTTSAPNGSVVSSSSSTVPKFATGSTPLQWLAGFARRPPVCRRWLGQVPDPGPTRGRGQHQGQSPVPGSEELTRATALPCTIHAIVRPFPDRTDTPIGSAPVDVSPTETGPR